MSDTYAPKGACANLLVKDVDAALPWYEEKLGFAVVKRRDGPPAGAVLERDGLPLLVETTEGEIVPRSKHRDPFGLDALFLVPDLKALHDDLRERGLVSKPLPDEASDFMVQTPEGYLVVFSAGL